MARKKLARSAANVPVRVTEDQVLTVLIHGAITERGLLPYSSNHSFLVTVDHDGVTLPAVYKPRRGESPLWDFEWGTLCQRETAAYIISHALGWGLVPPTVLRDGPHGVGSVQLFIPNNETEHYFTVQEDARFTLALRRLALFDFVVNNADRKSGHCLIAADGGRCAIGDDHRLWAIDHGICFHVEYKLRTVIWEFSDERIDDALLDELRRLYTGIVRAESAVALELCRLLSGPERAALLARLQTLLRTRTYPGPQVHRRNYPWPPV